MSPGPPMQFARDGDTAIAYQTLGDGPLDVVFKFGNPVSIDIESLWEEPAIARFLTRIATFARLIVFDARGTGKSDRGFSTYQFEDGMADIRAVLDDLGSERAAIMGVDVAGRLALMFAATYPERTSAVVTFGSHPTTFSDPPDYPWGSTHEEFDMIIYGMDQYWGHEEILVGLLGQWTRTAENDPVTQKWWMRSRQGLSRREAIAALKATTLVDVRPLLETVQVPVLVMHRLNNPGMASASRYLAEHIAGAKLVEFAGIDRWPFFESPDEIVEEIEQFLTGARSPVEADRVLATVLFSDIVGSTERASAMGDKRWRDLLDAHDGLSKAVIERFHGRLIDRTGDGFLATFDGPARAIRCAIALREEVRTLGIEIRCGLHTGEVEIRGDNIGGIAVHIGARVASEARPGEVVVSRTVADLVAGSSLEFSDRGLHALKGVTGEWQLFKVET